MYLLFQWSIKKIWKDIVSWKNLGLCLLYFSNLNGRKKRNTSSSPSSEYVVLLFLKLTIMWHEHDQSTFHFICYLFLFMNFHSLWTQKPPEWYISLWALRSWREAWQCKECLAWSQKGVCTNMQLLLVSVKPRQKSIVLKTTGQFKFLCEMLFFLSTSTPLYSLYQKRTLVA